MGRVPDRAGTGVNVKAAGQCEAPQSTCLWPEAGKLKPRVFAQVTAKRVRFRSGIGTEPSSRDALFAEMCKLLPSKLTRIALAPRFSLTEVRRNERAVRKT